MSETQHEESKPNAIRALLVAIVLAVLAWTMGYFGELRRFEYLMLLYPPLIGGLSIAAWRDGRRTWCSLRDDPPPAGVGLLKFFTWLALALDTILVLSAIVVLHALITGPWVR